MPAFTFEKISPEKISPQVRRGPTPAIPVHAVEKKPRGVIFQMLDRLVVVRVKRTPRRDNGIIARREQGQPD
jgi:DNA helicase TIP49 (TBP-interacting protein)